MRCDEATGPCRVVLDGSVGVISLQRLERSNALDRPMMHALVSALDRLSATSEVRAVVLTGTDDVFCLGADPADLEDGAADHLDSLLDVLADLVVRVAEGPLPVVAALNGHAAGAGLALALACDFRISGQRCALDLAYGRLGLPPDGGTSWFLPRLIGEQPARRLLFDQPILRAPAAMQLGLVDDVVPAADVLPRARSRAAELARSAPAAVRSVRRLLSAPVGALRAQLEAEKTEFLAALHTDDVRRALAMHRDGVLPSFEGR